MRTGQSAAALTGESAFCSHLVSDFRFWYDLTRLSKHAFIKGSSVECCCVMY